MIQDKPRPNRPIHRTLTISAKTRTVARIGCSATLRKWTEVGRAAKGDSKPEQARRSGA
jgi:hypothetical protein